MPEDPTAIPAWLDRQLLGPDLPSLVAELRTLHKPGAKPNLDTILGDDREDFLSGGFTALPRPVLRQLLRNPDLLLELAAIVYAEGSDFWFEEPLDADLEARATKVAANVRAAIAAEPRRHGSSWRWVERAVWGVAVAAAVVLTVNLTPPTPGGWGFNKIAELPRNADADTVFATLADLADEWDKQPTPDPDALARRLSEFRLGCSKLQRATDLPLPPAEVVWLKGRCREWAREIDDHLRDLDRTGDVTAVRTAATATAAAIARELRERNAT